MKRNWCSIVTVIMLALGAPALAVEVWVYSEGTPPGDLLARFSLDSGTLGNKLSGVGPSAGGATRAIANSPAGLFTTPEMFVSEFFNNVRYNATTGAFIGLYPTANATFVQGADFGFNGNIYISSSDGSVRQLDNQTGAQIGAPLVGPLASSNFTGLAFGPGGLLYVADAGTTKTIRKYDAATGASLGTIGAFADARDVAVDKNGVIYVADPSLGQITRWNSDGTAFGANPFITGGIAHRALDFGPNNELLTTEFANGAADFIYRWDMTTGASLGQFQTSTQNEDNLAIGVNTDFGFVAFPEPTTLALLSLGGLMLIRRRR